MATLRNVRLRWILAGLALSGLAGGVLAATDQSGAAGADPGSATSQSADAGPAAGTDQPAPPRAGPGAPWARAHYGGWDGPRGPEARPMGPPRWHHPPMNMGGRRFGEPMLDRPLLLAFRRLDLTDPQWQRVQAILEVEHLRRGAGSTTPEQRRDQLAALLDPGDPHHAAAVQAAKDLAVARIDQAAHTQQALYEVLTPAQKTRLQQLVAQRREQMRERLQQREQRAQRTHRAHPDAQGSAGQDAAPPAASPGGQ